METTYVVFRIKDSEVFALFPYLTENRANFLIQSYAHIGQHSGANYDYCIQTSKPAKPSDYNSLLEELKSIGYENIKVINRVNKDKMFKDF